MFMSGALPGVQGKPSPLLSSFRLSYYTLLNLMKRVEGGTHDLEYVIANSFQQFQQEQAMPKVCTHCTALHCSLMAVSYQLISSSLHSVQAWGIDRWHSSS